MYDRETVNLIEVRDDSRCPEGVKCAWAGQAKVRLAFNSQTFDLTFVPGQAIPAGIDFDGYAIQLLDLSAKGKGAYKVKVIVHRAMNQRSIMPHGGLNATYGQAFEITQDVQAVFIDHRRVDFIKVLNDSRHPGGIWAGEAKVRLAFNSQAVDLTFVPGQTIADGADFDGYAIQLLDLSTKGKGAYKAKIIVHKAVKLSFIKY